MCNLNKSRKHFLRSGWKVGSHFRAEALIPEDADRVSSCHVLRGFCSTVFSSAGRISSSWKQITGFPSLAAASLDANSLKPCSFCACPRSFD